MCTLFTASTSTEGRPWRSADRSLSEPCGPPLPTSGSSADTTWRPRHGRSRYAVDALLDPGLHVAPPVPEMTADVKGRRPIAAIAPRVEGPHRDGEIRGELLDVDEAIIVIHSRSVHDDPFMRIPNDGRGGVTHLAGTLSPMSPERSVTDVPGANTRFLHSHVRWPLTLW